MPSSKSDLHTASSFDRLQRKSKHNSRLLKRLQHINELILASLGEGIFGLDRNGKVIFVNPAALSLLGFTKEEILGRNMHTMTHFQYRDGNPYPVKECPIYHAIHSGKQTTGGDEWFFTKKKEGLPVAYTSMPLIENNEIVGAVVSFSDRTETLVKAEALSRLNTELTRSNRDLQDFASVASHDLQEPLRKILAFSSRLKTNHAKSLPEEAQDYLMRIDKATTRMQSLINDLLTFSRISTQPESFHQVNLNTIVQEVLEDLEAAIEQKQAEVTISHLPTIEADPLQMRQLFQNLIGNALKFSDKDRKPLINITTHETKKDSKCVNINVKDNGIGFDEKYLDKIFTVFQRLHNASDYSGTGVGLAVCRKIVERHKGFLTGKSKLHQGSTFIITLPISQSHDPLTTSPYPHNKSSSKNNHMQTLHRYQQKEVNLFEQRSSNHHSLS